MKLNKMTLTKDSNSRDLQEALMLACKLGFLDNMKGLKEKTGKAISKALCEKCMSRHEKALAAAYKMGFDQSKNK